MLREHAISARYRLLYSVFFSAVSLQIFSFWIAISRWFLSLNGVSMGNNGSLHYNMCITLCKLTATSLRNYMIIPWVVRVQWKRCRSACENLSRQRLSQLQSSNSRKANGCSFFVTSFTCLTIQLKLVSQRIVLFQFKPCSSSWKYIFVF